MKVIAFIGTGQKKHTYNYLIKFIGYLQNFRKFQYEIVDLSKFNIKTCTGCALCMNKGEVFCPHKDDREILVEKMEEAQVVIFATPNYAFQVSGLMKNFIDRTAYLLHRPMFFDKIFMALVVQGIFGGESIGKYLNFVAGGMGFTSSKTCVINTLEPISNKNLIKNEKALKRSADLLIKTMDKNKKPSIIEVIKFRMSRTGIKKMLNEEFYDYGYFLEKNWFKTDYYYPVKMGIIKKTIGKLFDFIAEKIY